MRTITQQTIAAALVLAAILTLSCSSSDDGEGGGGIPFNENSQIYNRDGTHYTGSGVIEMYPSNDVDCSNGNYGYDCAHLSVGSVTNGIVKLEPPKTIPDEYLREGLFFAELSESDKRSCPDYPKDISKGSWLGFALTNNNEKIAEIRHPEFVSISYDGRYEGEILFWYSIKAGKITYNCEKTNYKGDNYTNIVNLDIKAGLNILYIQRNYVESKITTQEISTNNILTKEKELKWFINLVND